PVRVSATGGLRPPLAGFAVVALARAVGAPVDAEPLLQQADVAAQPGQVLQAEQDALRLALRAGGGAEHALTGADVAEQPRAGAEDGAVADVDVVGDAHLARHHHVVAGAAAAGDADLADQQVVPADLAVVADHHQVVDLGA